MARSSAYLNLESDLYCWKTNILALTEADMKRDRLQKCTQIFEVEQNNTQLPSSSSIEHLNIRLNFKIEN